MGPLLSPALPLESVLLGMFQAALQAKSSCIDSLQVVVARQREELALAWASIEKERQARTVAEDGVKALQCALDKCREELRGAMQTRRGDHNKLLHQLSCEWQVLEVLEEEQRKREAAEGALALTHAWMERCLLRCDQLQRQHRLQRQQIKAAHADRDARWQSWAREAAAEHEHVRQLCHDADIALPDFTPILPKATPPPPATGVPPESEWACKGETQPVSSGESPLTKSTSCVELPGGGVPQQDMREEMGSVVPLGRLGLRMGRGKGLPSLPSPPALALPSRASAARQGLLLQSPNKTPRVTPNKMPVEDFGGLVQRIVAGAAPLLDGKRGVGRSPLAGPASKSAPTSPLRKTFVTRISPSQGLKDLPCNPISRNESRQSRGNYFRDVCQLRACVGQSQEMANSQRSSTFR